LFYDSEFGTPKKYFETFNIDMGRVLHTPITDVEQLKFDIMQQLQELGKDDITDFLCISFSSTDYVGHQFGPNSIEVEDTYLRLDQDLAELLKTLDQKVKGTDTMAIIKSLMVLLRDSSSKLYLHLQCCSQNGITSNLSTVLIHSRILPSILILSVFNKLFKWRK
jgi:hypothetical protein